MHFSYFKFTKLFLCATDVQIKSFTYVHNHLYSHFYYGSLNVSLKKKILFIFENNWQVFYKVIPTFTENSLMLGFEHEYHFSRTPSFSWCWVSLPWFLSVKMIAKDFGKWQGPPGMSDSNVTIWMQVPCIQHPDVIF